jgi:DNA-binding transcriptional ArsR family regulator
VTETAGRFARLPDAAVFDARLSAEALRVLAALATYADSVGFCFPALTTIAKRLGLERRTVQRHLRKLEAAGYVVTGRSIRSSRGGYGRNRYLLVYPAAPSPGAPAQDGMEGGGAVTLRTGRQRPSAAKPAQLRAMRHRASHRLRREQHHTSSRCDTSRPAMRHRRGQRCDTGRRGRCDTGRRTNYPS